MGSVTPVTFARTDSFTTHDRVEDEIHPVDHDLGDVTRIAGVTAGIGPDGRSRVEVVPPGHGRGRAWALVGCGVALLVVGVVLLVTSSSGDRAGRIAGGLVALLWGGLLVPAGWAKDLRWVFDSRGIRQERLGSDVVVPWDAVRRMRLVAHPRTTRRVGRWRLRRLWFLDETGRSLAVLPYVHPTSGQADADRRALEAIANDLHRRGWLTRFRQGLPDEERITPLMDAAGRGDLAAIDAEVAAGAEVDAVDTQGYTALHYAALWGTEEAIDRLLAAGADIDLRSPAGDSAYLAAKRRGLATADHLEARGASTGVPPLGTVRFSRRHWLPVVLPVLLLAAAGGIALLLLIPPRDAVEVLVLLLVGGFLGLLLVPLVRPGGFWSSGVPREQTDSRVSLRRPWGRRLVVDLSEVRAVDRVPPAGHPVRPIRGVGLLLVLPEGRLGRRATPSRLRALGLAHAADRLLPLGDRLLYVVVHPTREAQLLSALLPRLRHRGAAVSTEAWRRGDHPRDAATDA